MGMVLASVDVSHVTNRSAVLACAKKLAEVEGAPLGVVTVVPDFGMSIVGTFFDKDAADKALAAARDRLHEISMATLGSDRDIKHIVRSGNVYEEILTAAEEVDASLIVLGSHKPDFKDYLLGPNAANVVRHAHCSVHVLRE